MDSGRRFGKFLLFEELAAQPRRQTYRARAAERGRSAALTTVEVPATELARFFPLFVEELSRAGLLFHTSVRQVHEFGQIEGIPFYTEEDVPGLDLATLLADCRRQRVPLPIPCALFIAREVAAALAYAHDRRLRSGAHLGVVHSAVLPAAVQITPEGDVKVGGFGIFRAFQRQALLPSFVPESAMPLLAPEVRGGRAVGPKADFYECVSLLYEALTFRSPEEMRMSGRVSPPSSLRGKVSPAIDALCALALAEEPRERHLRGDELERELTRVLYQESPLFAPRDLGDFVRRLRDGTVAREIEERRRQRPRDPRREEDDGPILDEEISEVRQPRRRQSKSPLFSSTGERPAPPVAALPEKPPEERAAPARSRWPVVVAALLVAGLVGAAIWFLLQN